MALPTLDASTPATVRVLAVLTTEQFGVLATATAEQVHTATILFAVTDHWDVVFAIRPATLKAQMAAASPRVAFQVDNRGVVATDRQAFVRVEFLGKLRSVSAEDPRRPLYLEVFAGKFPFGAALLEEPEIALYALTPERLRMAIGAAPPEDVSVPEEPHSAE